MQVFFVLPWSEEFEHVITVELFVFFTSVWIDNLVCHNVWFAFASTENERIIPPFQLIVFGSGTVFFFVPAGKNPVYHIDVKSSMCHIDFF